MNREKAFSTLIAGLTRLLGWTLRYELRDHVGAFSPDRKEPVIFIAWHNRILALPPLFSRRRLRNQRKLTVLTSASRDGGLLAAVVGKFGISAIRGSSSKRGAVALLQMTDAIQAGGDIIITPDGPRGPRYKLGPGVVFLAQKTGHGVSHVEVEYSRYWELKSWDRFRIPKPFSRVTVTLHPVQQLARTSTEDEFEELRLSLEIQLRTDQDLNAAANSVFAREASVR